MHSASLPALLKKSVSRLFVLSESRGREASGLALQFGGELHVLKQPITASKLIRTPVYQKIFSKLQTSTESPQSVAIMGHSRLVTNGSQALYTNNQPVIAQKIVGIHNGIITNHAELWAGHPELERHFEIDTEILLNLVRHELLAGGQLIPSIQSAYRQIRGIASIALMFQDLGQMILATNNGSLFVVYSETRHCLAFASEHIILERLREKKYFRQLIGPEFKSKQLVANQAYLLDLQKLDFIPFSLLSPSSNANPAVRCEELRLVEYGADQSLTMPAITKRATHVPQIFHDIYQKNCSAISALKRCTHCILPETMTFINFDEQGVCNYCRHYRKKSLLGSDSLQRKIQTHQNTTGGIDAIIGLSGGRDSCYGLHYLKKVLGLNPVAYTYDWGMVTDLARRNQSRLCGQLGVEHVLVSADIKWKRSNIGKNVVAWLRRPRLGTIPLFMAGDKQFFWHGNRLQKETRARLLFVNENNLEKTDFKTGFCGIAPQFDGEYVHTLNRFSKFKMISYYGSEFLQNPAYLNASVLDSLYAYACYYLIPHTYTSLYNYIEWREDLIDTTLIGEYDWELATDTKGTWRIGDGTAPFYNYIYHAVAGFTENDTLRSNQIREGHLDRTTALERVSEDNQPRYESIQWYADQIGIDWVTALTTINAMPKLYQV